MNHAQMRPLYISPNGDAWFLARDPATGAAFVRHEANRPSGGQVTDIEIGTFLSGPINPEHETLLRLIGSFIYGRDGAKSDDRSAEDTGKEWSTAELTELGNMLVAGLSMEEIARVLGRGRGEVRDKVVEVGRTCRCTGKARVRSGVNEKASESDGKVDPSGPLPEDCPPEGPRVCRLRA